MDVKEILNHHLWQLNKNLLIISGLWPYQNRCVNICIRISILGFICLSLIPQIIKLQIEWGRDLEIIIYNFTAILYFNITILRYVSFICIESKLRMIYEQITKDWKEYTDKEEKMILHRFTCIGRNLSVGCMIYGYGGTIIFVCSPVLVPAFLDFVKPLNASRDRILCFNGEYFIDQGIYFYPLFLHNFILLLCSNIIFTPVDSMYPSIIQHVIGLFNIVDHRLNKVCELVQILSFKKSQDLGMEIHKGVLRSIIVHKKSIRLAKQLESTFKMCLFLSISFLLVCLSVGPIVLVMNVKNYMNLIRLLAIFIISIVFLLNIFLPGEKIIGASLNICTSIYFSGWSDFPLKTQRLLMFMMMRASVPCQFKAGPLLVLNCKSCLSILKLAMSYFTFLVTMSYSKIIMIKQ